MFLASVAESSFAKPALAESFSAESSNVTSYIRENRPFQGEPNLIRVYFED